MKKANILALCALAIVSGPSPAYSFSQYVDGSRIAPDTIKCWYFEPDVEKYRNLPIEASDPLKALALCMEHYAVSLKEDPDHKEFLPVEQARR